MRDRRIPIDIRKLAAADQRWTYFHGAPEESAGAGSKAWLYDGVHRRYVMHLHGVFFDKNGFCLTPEEYRSTGAEVCGIMQEVLEGGFYLKHNDTQNHARFGYAALILIGTKGTVTDPHFVAILQNLRVKLLEYKAAKQHQPASSQEHPCAYWLVRGADEENECSNAVKGLKLEDVVHVIKYGDDYHELPLFLERLSCEENPHKKEEPRVTVTPREPVVHQKVLEQYQKKIMRNQIANASPFVQAGVQQIFQGEGAAAMIGSVIQAAAAAAQSQPQAAQLQALQPRQQQCVHQ